jgi:hypothetical protein
VWRRERLSHSRIMAIFAVLCNRLGRSSRRRTEVTIVSGRTFRHPLLPPATRSTAARDYFRLAQLIRTRG